MMPRSDLNIKNSRRNPPGRSDAIVFVVMLLLAAVCSGAGVPSGGKEALSSEPGSGQQTFEGIVTDTHCAAKHSTSINLSAGNCTIQCVRMGQRFSLVDGEASYILSGDLQALKPFAGQRVKISGTLRDNDLTFTSIVPD